MYRLEGIERTYGEPPRELRVLTGVDAEIATGEFVVIIGRSGSGKSTLLNLLGALDLPTAGRLEFRGEDLAALPETRRARIRRSDIGFIFQSFNLVPALTVSENLRVPLAFNGIGGAAARERCSELLRAVGLPAAGARYPAELSGGEQQRVAVARAIAHRPAVVIADEPTGNLDLETARETIELLQNFCKQPGRSLVMATHSAEVMGRADRVLTIRDGRLAAGAP